MRSPSGSVPPSASGRNTFPASRVFGTVVGLDHADPGRPLHRREVRRGRLDLVVGHRFRRLDHLRGVGLPRVSARPQIVLEVQQLLHDVGVRQTGDRRVLRTALAVRHVTHPAPAHVGRTAMDEDVWHRRMIGREPVRHVEEVAKLRQRERLRAVGDVLERRVRRARGPGTLPGWRCCRRRRRCLPEAGHRPTTGRSQNRFAP